MSVPLAEVAQAMELRSSRALGVDLATCTRDAYELGHDVRKSLLLAER